SDVTPLLAGQWHSYSFHYHTSNMGSGQSSNLEIVVQVGKLLGSKPSEKLANKLGTLLDNSHEDLGPLLDTDITADSAISLLALLIILVHQQASKINAHYAAPKEEDSLDLSGLPSRLLLLHKSLIAAQHEPIMLSQYLWHLDGTVCPLITGRGWDHSARDPSCRVLLCSAIRPRTHHHPFPGGSRGLSASYIHFSNIPAKSSTGGSSGRLRQANTTCTERRQKI
ncbi:MAG: hypothetical protein P4M11_08975, partial [Candidatus Pacebacteria bacterium]|nr:hypothetical protein [Candidatus Paceibacterota bacterium]